MDAPCHSSWQICRRGSTTVGVLPEGVQFVGGSLQVVGDVEVAAPAVPMHRVLKKSFVLKSQAFMLTYNSKAFTRDT